MWYTQWKDNRPVEVGPIVWDTFKQAFLRKYFPCERKKVKIEEFINIRKFNMIVEDYSLNFYLVV